MRLPLLFAATIAVAGCQTESLEQQVASFQRNRLSATVQSDGTACGSRSELAALVMEGRQTGRPLSDAMAGVERADVDDIYKRDAQRMVLLAYGEPRYSTRDFQQRSVVEFANEAYRTCAL